MSFIVQHFEEKNRVNKEGLLSIEDYSKCLDYLVIACVDIVFMHKDKLLFGKRKSNPKKGWWIIGGRMCAGESPLEAVVRKTKQEADLCIEESRFKFLNVYSTCFSVRGQEPIHNGLHSVNLTYTVNLEDIEAKSILLTDSEYDEWAWLKLDELKSKLSLDNSLDIALLKIAEEAFELEA